MTTENMGRLIYIYNHTLYVLVCMRESGRRRGLTLEIKNDLVLILQLMTALGWYGHMCLAQ